MDWLWLAHQNVAGVHEATAGPEAGGPLQASEDCGLLAPSKQRQFPGSSSSLSHYSALYVATVLTPTFVTRFGIETVSRFPGMEEGVGTGTALMSSARGGRAMSVLCPTLLPSLNTPQIVPQ